MRITRSIKKDEITKDWYIIDATNIRLGKLATKAATMLIGKDKTTKTTNMVNGSSIIIINSENIDVHPRKLKGKMYHSHSGYIGGLKSVNLEELLAKKPNKVIEHAIKGMLPKNKLGRAMFKNLHVFQDNKHPFDAQQPKIIEVK